MFARKSVFHYGFLLLFLPHIVVAENKLEDGIAAVEQKDFKTAVQIFRNLADQGNAEAQYNLAILYRQGEGVKKNNSVALEWFEKSAQQGLASAQYYLGHLYDTGDSVSKDPVKAVTWYKQAAEKGNPLAQSNLGVAYASGEGVQQDIIKAYVWFSLAASQGLTAALENRNILKKEMSEELQKNAQRLTREYFNKYVAPFKLQTNKLSRSGHPGVPQAHQRMNQPAAGQNHGDDQHNHSPQVK